MAEKLTQELREALALSETTPQSEEYKKSLEQFLTQNQDNPHLAEALQKNIVGVCDKAFDRPLFERMINMLTDEQLAHALYPFKAHKTDNRDPDIITMQKLLSSGQHKYLEFSRGVIAYKLAGYLLTILKQEKNGQADYNYLVELHQGETDILPTAIMIAMNTVEYTNQTLFKALREGAKPYPDIITQINERHPPKEKEENPVVKPPAEVSKHDEPSIDLNHDKPHTSEQPQTSAVDTAVQTSEQTAPPKQPQQNISQATQEAAPEPALADEDKLIEDIKTLTTIEADNTPQNTGNFLKISSDSKTHEALKDLLNYAEKLQQECKTLKASSQHFDQDKSQSTLNKLGALKEFCEQFKDAKTAEERQNALDTFEQHDVNRNRFGISFYKVTTVIRGKFFHDQNKRLSAVKSTLGDKVYDFKKAWENENNKSNKNNKYESL